MPRGDGTGPAGLGPMTGRAAGYCAGFGNPGSMNFSLGRGYTGWGRGRGGGRGFRNRYYATGLFGWQRAAAGWPAWGDPYFAGMANNFPAPLAMTGEQELETLQGQAKYIEDALQDIRKRLEELEGKTNKA
jgi:hypothetical protein